MISTGWSPAETAAKHGLIEPDRATRRAVAGRD
jgi:hypothetical protein